MTAGASQRWHPAESLIERCAAVRALPRRLNARERAALSRFVEHGSLSIDHETRSDLTRLLDPIDEATETWPLAAARTARKAVLIETHRRGSAYWSWGEATWARLIADATATDQDQRQSHLVALGYLLGGHRRLHHKVRVPRLGSLAEFVFGPGAVDAAVDDVVSTLGSWGIFGPNGSTRAALLDALLSNASPHLAALSRELLQELVAVAPVGGSRRAGLLRLSRVLAANGLLAEPLTPNDSLHGMWASTLDSVPEPWLAYALRWRDLSTREQSTSQGMFSCILIAGRWAAETHPDAVDPANWTRDVAAEYVAATTHAVNGQWAGANRNRTRDGQALSPGGKENRIGAVRGFFNDLIDWEWITPRFNPRQVLTLPTSVRAQLGPNPRIIEDAAWAKLMAAGLTLTADDLRPHGTPRGIAAGRAQPYYPIEMIRALVAVWLFAGCRIDEIRRLELGCVSWDHPVDENTGQPYRMCLLRVPANKTSREFTKPIDPLAGELIEAWQAVRPPQPDIVDRKTGQRRQHLFCHRAQLIGRTYLNEHIIPLLCAKAGVPETDSRGALTSHRARTTIATQLLNAREPLSLDDLQQWLGHKHPSSTRHYAAILQRTLSAAYRRADYFARNVRTIQVLIDRDAILTGAATGGQQPWKYYDLGDGYCSYDFFAKCPHRLACARCPFYVPKQSAQGQLLAVKDGISEMLEQLDLTDDERAALEGDREAVDGLIERLADITTPVGRTPHELGTKPTLIPVTALTTHPQNITH